MRLHDVRSCFALRDRVSLFGWALRLGSRSICAVETYSFRRTRSNIFVPEVLAYAGTATPLTCAMVSACQTNPPRPGNKSRSSPRR